MEDSQSSDLFPEMSGNVQHCSNIETYTELVSKIKAYEYLGAKSIIVPEDLNIILDDGRSCIIQSLEIIVSLIEDSNTLIDRVCGYIEDVVHILHILSNFIKTIIESVSITSRTSKNFCTFTGNIILSVFTHCKDSECIYGNNIFVVEKQLKELFRNCHELQMTYLMVLENHFLFDLNVKDDQKALEKTLEINLKIGDVVQSLDVKTMAEQWKAYTVICEKYSSFLLETFFFNRICKLLASTIKTNVKTALEAEEKDKIVLRSLKVASFSLKILLKLCNIFKCSVHNDYEDIVKLLLNISVSKSSYYEINWKTPEFSALMYTHLSIPSDNLIDILANEEKFLNLVLLKDISALSDVQLLEHILLLTSIINVLRAKDLNDIEDVIKSVFAVLPVCHKWFNMGLKLKYTPKDGDTHSCGLYEYLLLNFAAFTITFSSQQYNNLEKYLYEALLGTDYYCSLFASHLWVLLCRLGNDKLQLDTLISLLRVYKKIESHISFNTSPQRVHLSYTIEKLFKSLHNKLHIYRKFNINDAENVGVWSVLKVRNLHDHVPKSVDRVIIDNLFTSFNEFAEASEDSLDNLVKFLRIASTCSIVERDLKLKEFLIRCWLKACPVCNNIQTNSSIDIWYFKYLEGLTSLTECYMEKFEERNSLVKILNIISKILLLRNNETVHLLFIFFCKLSSFLLEDENVKISIILTNTIKNLMIGDNDNQQYVFNIIAADDKVNKLIIPVLNDHLLKNVRDAFVDFKNKFNDEEWQNQMEMASKYSYKHKCLIIQKSKSIETKNDTEIEAEGNFDLGNIDSMFGESVEKEPASKKAKMDCDVESLIVKLEADVDQLSQVKENLLNVEYKVRIRQACDKLKSIIS